MASVKCIGLVTPGGDAPGINSAIRAISRAAIYNGLRVKAVYRGFQGLIDGNIREFMSEDVSNVVQRGGTMLRTNPCVEFTTAEGREKAYRNMVDAEIDALIAVGGDGSMTGLRLFAQEYNVPCIGVPATIDNDLYGTDTTIGYDTAMNTLVDIVDHIRDTAHSHERIFFVEVRGNDSGFLVLNAAIAAGCEGAIIPELETKEDQLSELIRNGYRKSKNSSIILVANTRNDEGALYYAERVKNEFPGYNVRVTIVGYLLRGGSPSSHDRVIASRLGVASVEALMQGQRNVMVGLRNDEIVYVPFSRVIRNKKSIDANLMKVLHNISI